MKTKILLWLVFLSTVALAQMPSIELVKGQRGFQLTGSQTPFVPWGFNYYQDGKWRYLDDYWIEEWEAVASDFRDMQAAGANVVRIQLQFRRFMETATRPNQVSLNQLARLLALAEELGLYLDITGLGCFHEEDAPDWYNTLDEAGRWAVQARFWEAVAKTCSKSPAVFCYDLMKTPGVPKAQTKTWLYAERRGSYVYQYITRDLAGRNQSDVAKQWIATLTGAIRQHDCQHLITIGLPDEAAVTPGANSGMDPKVIAPSLDFLSTELTPQKYYTFTNLKMLDGEEAREAPFKLLDALRATGKTVLICETIEIPVGLDSYEDFLTASAKQANGWLNFYPARSLADLNLGKTPGVRVKKWLARFRKGPPSF